MRIHRIRLANYRGVEAREVTFAERGVTVVQGANEVGKTSLAEAVDLILEHYDDSKRAAVRAVKPVHVDAGTEVEVELSAGPYRLTYAKRFHRERSTQLTVHSPSPEHLTGREAHDRVRAILAEQVDLALWRALRIVQGQAVTQPDLGEVSSLAAALDVAADGAEGGEREQTVLQRAQAEYARYFTPTGQDNAWFKGLRAEHDAAEHDLTRARAALTAIEQDVERCASIARELDALRPAHDEQQTRLRDLERQWESVRERAAEVERLALTAERSAHAVQQAEHAAAERRRLTELAEQSAAEAADLAAERERVAPALATAVQEEQARTRELEQLREELGAARETERAAREAEARSRDAFSLELLEERWQRITAARTQAAAARKLLDGRPIDETALERIEEAHLTLAQARAAWQEDGATLVLRAEDDVDAELDGQPLRLEAGQSREVRVTEQLRLRVGGLDALLTPGEGSAALRARVEQSRLRFDEACAAAGVTDLAQARQALRDRHDAERTVTQAERSIAENLRDLSFDQLEDKLAQLRERVTPAQPTDVDDAKRALAEAQDRVRELETQLDSADSAVRDATARRSALREAHADLQVRAERAAQEATAAASALATARAEMDDAALQERLEGARRAAAADTAAHQAAREALDAEDPDSVAAAVANAGDVADKQRQAIRELEDELRELRGRLSALGETGLQDRLDAAATRAERAGQAWRQAERGAAAARLLHDTLLRHREAARRAYAAPLREKLESLGRIVFGADFAVELGDDLRVARRTLDGLTLDVDQLSTGAREQLSVLSRLAVAAITAGDGGVPLLLDDALGWSDPARLEAMGAAFHVAGRDSQVIVLTCVPDRYRHIGSATTVRL